MATGYLQLPHIQSRDTQLYGLCELIMQPSGCHRRASQVHVALPKGPHDSCSHSGTTIAGCRAEMPERLLSPAPPAGRLAMALVRKKQCASTFRLDIESPGRSRAFLRTGSVDVGFSSDINWIASIGERPQQLDP